MKAALFLCLVSFSLLASSARADIPEVGDYTMLRNRVQTLVKQASREIVLYSYSSGDAKYVDPDNADKAGWIEWSLKAFFDIKEKPADTYFGQGLYLAQDPVIGKSDYGSSSNKWRLLKLSVRPGAKFLDLRGPKIKETFPTKTGEVKVGNCWTKNVIDLFHATKTKECRVVVYQLLQETGVTFFTYEWWAKQNPICPKQKDPSSSSKHFGTAFVLTSQNGVDMARTKYLTSVGAPDNAAYDRAIIKGFAATATDMVPSDFPYGPGSSDVQTLSEYEVRDYLKEKYFGCNEAKYAEDRIP